MKIKNTRKGCKLKLTDHEVGIIYDAFFDALQGGGIPEEDQPFLEEFAEIIYNHKVIVKVEGISENEEV